MNEDVIHNDNFEGRYPLCKQDLENITSIVQLIRECVSLMSPYDMRSASTLLLALERLPYATPSVNVYFSFGTGERDGNSAWVDINISEEEFRLGAGEYLRSAAGGDTQSRTLFETQAGSEWREGEIEEWLAIASGIGHANISADDHSDHEAIDWSLDDTIDDCEEN